MKKSFSRVSGLVLAVAALAAVGGVQAQATTSTSRGMFAMSDRPVTYFGFGVGQTDYRLGNGSGLYGSDNRSTAYNLSAGSYFTNNVGVEVGFTDFGRINRAGGQSRADGFNLSLVGKLPLAPSFNLLGKIGTTYGRTEVSALAGSGITPGRDVGFGLSLGLGAEYMVTKNWSGVLQYDVHDLRFAGGASDRDRIGVTTLGLRYTF